MKKITIGIFNDSFYPMTDGVIAVIDNYARRLSKYANVIVFVPKYIGKKYDDSIFPYKVVRCISIKLPFLDHSVPVPKADVKFMIKKEKYNLDIVHVHSPFMMGRIGVEYAKKHNVPCIGTMHSQFEQDFKRYFKNDKVAKKLNTKEIVSFFDKCDECWAVNKETARIFYEDYGVKDYPKVMPNATEMKPIFNVYSAKNLINKKYNIKKCEKVFLFVGRINLLKNILFIADSLKTVSLLDEKLKWKMVFVGSGNDLHKLKHHVEKLGISKNVIYAGKILDKKELAFIYARADLFLFPSLYDTSGIVKIEAASQKTPSLLLKNSAAATEIEDNISGFLSDDDPNMFAKRIIEIMHDEKLLKTVSQNSYKILYNSWDTIVDKAYKMYIKLIKEYQKK